MNNSIAEVPAFGPQATIGFIKRLLPDHYQVSKLPESPNAFRCVSKIGIKKNGEQEDEEHWSYIMQALKSRFGSELSEVYHNVCFAHKDFIIYLKK